MDDYGREPIRVAERFKFQPSESTDKWGEAAALVGNNRICVVPGGRCWRNYSWVAKRNFYHDRQILGPMLPAWMYFEPSESRGSDQQSYEVGNYPWAIRFCI